MIPKNGADQLTPAAVKWDPYRDTDTQWHVIPASMADEVNLTGSVFEFDFEMEAVLAHYFCTNFMETVGNLVGTLPDGIWEVPVTMNCSQGLHRKLTTSARDFVDPETLSDCKKAMDYLKDKRWWEVARPMDTATDMMDLLQPLLSCKSWDWHGATTACVLMKWAGLLSIVGMDANKDPSWQRNELDFLSHVPLAATLEGSPRGHPWNINMRYIHGDMSMIDSAQIEVNSDKLDTNFTNLRSAKPPQVPTRQTMANACVVLHGVQVVSAEVKSLSDKNDAGFQQQALLMADFFARRDPQYGPKVAIGLHMNASKIRLQTLELEQKMGGGFQTMMRRKVFSTEGYRLHLRQGEAVMQAAKMVPRFKFKGPAREEKFVDALDWGQISTCFHSYVIALLQALWKLCKLYTINGYGTQLVSNNVETVNTNVWNNCVQVLHRTDCSEALDDSVQDVYFDSDFNLGNNPNPARNTELPTGKQVLRKICKGLV